jgi:Fe-S-cluster containining protein
VSNPFYLAAIGTIREIRRDVRDSLKAPDQPEEALLAVKRALRWLSDLANQIPHRDEWHCRRGCSFCCHNPVAASALEVLRIAGRFGHIVAPDSLVQVRGRLAARVRRQAGMSWDAILDSDLPCGLLEPDGACAVYAERPLACRGFVSFDVEACRASMGKRDDEILIPLDPTLMAGGQAVRTALRIGVADHGLETRVYELNSALQRALETEHAALRWIRGEDVFLGCRTDETLEGDTLARQLSDIEQQTR